MSDAYYDAQLKNDITRNVRQYRDLDLFFSKKTERKDINVLTDILAVKRSVRNLILLNHYEKPFHPEIGASIRDALFEPNDSFSINVMENRIRDTLQNYEPRIILEKVEAVTGEAKDFFGDQSNEIRVKVEFYLKNAVTDLIEYETIIQRAR